MRDLPSVNKTKTHCKHGHMLSSDNLRIRKDGARICLKCRSLNNKKFNETHRSELRAYGRRESRAKRKAGKLRYGYTASVTKTFTRDEVERAIEAVRENGKIYAALDVLGKWKGLAFLYFNPKLRAQLKKLKFSPPPLICRPAIITAPASANLLVDRINAAVSPSLPRDMRDDVISEMTLAVLEGRLRQSDIERRAGEFVRGSFKADHNKWGALSLDKPMFDDSTVTLGDTITRGMWD